MTWDVRDRYGNQIYITQERWNHALEKRPWLADYFDDVLDTLQYGRRQQDPLNLYKYKYYWPCTRLEPEFTHMIAVVLFRETTTNGHAMPNNYVVNVWAAYIYGHQ